MNRFIIIGLLVAYALGLSACVAKRKFLAAQSRISMLRSDSARLANRVSSLEGEVGSLDAANRDKASQLDQNQAQIQSQQQRLRQLQALIDQQQKNTEALRKKMADALVGFNASQLTVSVKNGKVYVSMQESLLFPSGSAVVNPKGKEALSTLAQVLNQNPDINVEVEGHTDSIPISKRYEDNWALSVARSTAIVRILTRDYSVASNRVTASGRSWYNPVADNSTPEGRQLNRRTEIILAPKLDELMKLIGESATPPK